jgi:uncharacterized protein (DUF305 family)
MKHHMARFWGFWLSCLLLGGGVPLFFAQQAPESGTVAVRIEAEERQPIGMPLVIQVHVQNTGSKPISWWCGVGSRLPGASRFKVETKHKGDAEWQIAQTTNNEADEGSGRPKELKVGDTLTVPLVVSVRPQSLAGHVTKEPVYVEAISIRVRSIFDGSKSTAETSVSIYHDPRLVDARRYKMIRGMTDTEDSFWKHMATHHADAVVLDAAFRLAGLDNRSVADAACQVLARQPTVPESHAAELSRIVRKWAAEGDLDASFITAALATRAEVARQTALDLLVEKPNDITAFRVVDALKWSPGDKQWLIRMRSEIEKFHQRGLRNERLESDTLLALDRIKQRLSAPEKK